MDQFWTIIAEACGADPHRVDEWDERLKVELGKLQPAEINAWDRIFHDLTEKAYSWDLWGAAYEINGGASDDGFYYFRCWLVCMGRGVYEAALADPDSLADVVAPGIDAESEVYGVAHSVWEEMTGSPDSDDDFGPEKIRPLEPAGEEWDFGGDETKRRLPRLSAVYSDE